MSYTPVVVGASQLSQRNTESDVVKEPIELMLDAVQAAFDDTERPDLLNRVSSIRVIRGVWPYENPAHYLAENLGLSGVETGITSFGGNGVQSTINLSALDIQDGRHEVVVLVGAECGRSQAKARRSGTSVDWTRIDGKPEWTLPQSIGKRHEAEASRGIGSAIMMYALVENAIRYSRKESISEHIQRVSELWARFNQVATQNPHAWIRDSLSAEEIRTPGPSNRRVSFPYPKLMNANNNVDQAAALVLCSSELAQKLGIPKNRWVYPWAGTDAHDTYVVSERDNLYSAPGMRTAAHTCLDLCSLTADDVDHVDLYSCFPSAVQVAAREIGLSEQRPLTVTGGLTFGGGPLNNYVTHAIARMVEVLRARPEEMGLVTANGGILTKHAIGVYSSQPPPSPFQHRDVQDIADGFPTRDVEVWPRGSVVTETYTVMYRNDQPQAGFVSLLTGDGKRTWGRVEDSDVLHAMTEQEFCGQTASVDESGIVTFA